MAEGTNRSALYILMFNMFIAMSGIGLIIPIMPAYLETFGAAGQVLGFLISSFALAQFLFSPISGNLSDRYGRKKLIIFGLVVFGLSQLAFGLATELWMLFVARFITGFGAAFLIPPMMAFVADITTFDDRGKGMGWLGASMSLGFMIGPSIGGFLSGVSLQFPFYIACSVALIAALSSALILPDPRPEAGPEKQEPKKQENIVGQLKRSIAMNYFILLIITLVFSFGLANFQATISMYMDKKYAYTPAEIAILMTIGGFIGVVVQTFVVDPLFRKFGEMRVILVNLLIAAVSMSCILFVDRFWSLMLISTFFFTATSLLRPALNTLISKMAGNEQGFAAGLINAYMSLGNMFGPALAGTLFDINMAIPYMFGTAVLLICFGITVTWARLHKEQLQALRSRKVAVTR
ncbi:MFS transporter, DHA1 family, multidrug resistance protein [Bhargavaea ginsengi]|uniref:MFS transporter, DHA1 family, multidrug resistance protein n=1 Tax=Bhargavaea ginsengi TaxID=426757 RepID=A0A1H6T3R8_9BACL|nr:MFS transporter [Bhargavaea ginsengi]MCM3087269.1 MFS transporter [Bhargavaea ginsengi]SEI74779.1 MFS transporter, DHA1 family, multidrug resistance protein [Bhargavaea ginsengi]